MHQYLLTLTRKHLKLWLMDTQFSPPATSHPTFLGIIWICVTYMDTRLLPFWEMRLVNKHKVNQ